MRAQDDILYSLSQDRFTEFDSYEIFDFSVMAIDKDNRWNATVYVKNAFDEFYVSNIASNVTNFTPNGYLHNLPRYYERTVGAEMRYRW